MFGDCALVGDARWAGTYGVDGDFIARDNCRRARPLRMVAAAAAAAAAAAVVVGGAGECVGLVSVLVLVLVLLLLLLLLSAAHCPRTALTGTYRPR